jgi:phosphopentomutase
LNVQGYLNVLKKVAGLNGNDVAPPEYCGSPVSISGDTMRRVILIVMDGCGVGAMPDAAGYGESDPASATVPHVSMAVGGLTLPTLERIGFGCVAPILGLAATNATGAWGRSAIASSGKDSLTGHWEMMGIISEKPYPTYPNGFPADLIDAFERLTGRKALGNRPASGTEIIHELGDEHVRTGNPIVYTSVDSVFQIAAHESVIPLDEQYEMCRQVRKILVAPHNIQRVIARPFVGDGPDTYKRTTHRRDFPLPPPPHNLLQFLKDAHIPVHAIGVVAELFPADLFTSAERTQTNAEGLAAIAKSVTEGETPFVFANCEDFDMLYGHRNDTEGFARALTEFDAALAGIVASLRPDDLLILTADHGNDPTLPGTDHTREYVPVLATGASVRRNAGFLGRTALADVAATVAQWLEIDWKGVGRPLEIFV